MGAPAPAEAALGPDPKLQGLSLGELLLTPPGRSVSERTPLWDSPFRPLRVCPLWAACRPGAELGPELGRNGEKNLLFCFLVKFIIHFHR